jgi:minor extracellular serine protease Vpr
MRGGITRGASLLAVGLLAVVMAAGATAQSTDAGGTASDETSAKRFSQVFGASNNGNFTPAALAQRGPVRVILQLDGAPVAVRDASTDAERNAIRASLAARQATVASAVTALGGTVTNRFQDAFNGIAAVVPGSKLAELGAIAGVKRVSISRTFKPDNAATANYMNVPTVWNGATGFTGSGILIAVIDSGVDYTHATFGGPGTEAAYDDADDRDTTLEGDEFNEKVVGGWDLVGDDYNADSDEPEENTPQPDPDPLDCDGHGSHVAGTAAGYGVRTNGSTFAGPWRSDTLTTTNFVVPPGMAPEAEIFALRVFGCGGSASEEVIVEAIERAVEAGADVINMSLGSSFGRPDEPSTIAANNASLAGVSVVGSSGNSGPSAYITGAPNVADRTISVAAVDASFAQLPGAIINLPGGGIPAINANEAPIPSGSFQIVVLRNPDGTVSLGCDPAEYAGTAGKIVVTLRGNCARVARAVFGQKAGAAAVVMINTSSAFPPFEGPIDENPDTGEELLVTIPFLGVRGLLGPSPFDDADRLVAADGQTVSLTPSTVSNPSFLQFASFTSNGPRNPDSIQKPDVSAPGVSVLSTNEDSGFRGARISGTSMASPATAGVAALVRQAHPSWSPAQVKGAIMNTAEAGPTKFVSGYDVRRGGTGAVQADRAVATVAMTTTPEGRNTLSYGYDQLTGAYSETLPFTIHNTGGTALTYNLSSVFTGNSRGADFTYSANPVNVPAGGSTTVDVTIALTAAEVAALPDAVASNFGALAHSVDGVVIASPTTSGTGVMPLRVPFMWVPRGLSNVHVTSTPTFFNPTIGLRNDGIHAGTADVFTLAQTDANDVPPIAEDSTDIRAIGMQTLPREALCGTDPIGVCGTADDRALVFAINVWGYWANPSVSEFDILVNTDRDAFPEYTVVGVDTGAILAGAFDGTYASFVFDNETDDLVNAWVAEAPMNGSTMLLPFLASDIGLSGRAVRNPATRIEFQAFSFSIVPADDGEEATPDVNTLDDVTEPTTIGLGGLLAPDPRRRTVPGPTMRLEPGESTVYGIPNPFLQQALGAKGWMVVTHDDANGAPQADLVPAPTFTLPSP